MAEKKNSLDPKKEEDLELASFGPTIHRARLARGGSGAVLYGEEIDEETAVEVRKLGEDVVVRGNHKESMQLAKKIEEKVGEYKRHSPHSNQGNSALPHVQQKFPPPKGHCFYETSNLKARKDQ